MKKDSYFRIGLLGIFFSFGLWGGPIDWIVFRSEWYPIIYYVGFFGIILMIVGSIGYFLKKFYRKDCFVIEFLAMTYYRI